MTYYVDITTAVSGDGTQKNPFRTISEAAQKAVAGDSVIVAPGVYREYVNPANGGTESARITYQSQVPLGAVISGSERITEWKPYKGDVFVARIDNQRFGSYNPYTTLVRGDWFIATFTAHTGEVYLNGKSLYEVTSLEKVLSPEINEASWDKEFSVYTWYTEQDSAANQTVIYANFHGADPCKELVEINVRENCFYPSKEGVGYITLSGFTVRQAATQWAPPTAYQEGMIGPHWSKGWIIEDCEISDSKCSGISLGKYLQKSNDNKWLEWKYKDGTQTERECICLAQIEGWSKERIGSHIIRRCNIHDCGQTGIVGHLGGVFSLIEDNHIHHINNKQNLAGAEIGGIKMHAAIDVIIRRNNIHDCTRGLWLDWQAQGTRVTQNFFYNNMLPHDYLLQGAGRMGLRRPPLHAGLCAGAQPYRRFAGGSRSGRQQRRKDKGLPALYAVSRAAPHGGRRLHDYPARRRALLQQHICAEADAPWSGRILQGDGDQSVVRPERHRRNAAIRRLSFRRRMEGAVYRLLRHGFPRKRPLLRKPAGLDRRQCVL